MKTFGAIIIGLIALALLLPLLGLLFKLVFVAAKLISGLVTVLIIAAIAIFLVGLIRRSLIRH